MIPETTTTIGLVDDQVRGDRVVPFERRHDAPEERPYDSEAHPFGDLVTSIPP